MYKCFSSCFKSDESIVSPIQYHLTNQSGFTSPQSAVYNSPVSDVSRVKSLILTHRLAPYHKQSPSYKEECPICFITQPTGDTNITSCCGNTICTDCLVQLVFACPSLSVGVPRTERRIFSRHNPIPERYSPPACPFCDTQPDLTVRYQKSEPVSSKDIRLRASNSDALIAASLLSPTAERTLQQQELIRSALSAASTLSNRNSSRGQVGRMPGLVSLFRTVTVNSDRTEAVRNLTRLRELGVDIEDLMMIEAIRLSLQTQTRDIESSDVVIPQPRLQTLIEVISNITIETDGLIEHQAPDIDGRATDAIYIEEIVSHILDHALDESGEKSEIGIVEIEAIDTVEVNISKSDIIAHEVDIGKS